jgi:hypothetical protein
MNFLEAPCHWFSTSPADEVAQRHPLTTESARCLVTAQEATCLVLCIDTTNPQPCVWQATLPRLVNALASSTGSLIETLASRERDSTTGVPRILSPKRKLLHSRILLLLTKVDLLFAQVMGALRTKASRHSRGNIGPLLLLGLAENGIGALGLLDPVGLIEDLLGPDILPQLQSAILPSSRLAVAAVSARGIASFPSQASVGPPGLCLSSLSARPFGLSEALRFLVGGSAFHPVTEVAHRKHHLALTERWIECAV